jgi:hypothetical protein
MFVFRDLPRACALRLLFFGDDVDDVVVFGAAHGVAAVFFDFFEVLFAREVALGPNAGPVVAISEKLAGESAAFYERALDELPQIWELCWFAEGEGEACVY